MWLCEHVVIYSMPGSMVHQDYCLQAIREDLVHKLEKHLRKTLQECQDYHHSESANDIGTRRNLLDLSRVLDSSQYQSWEPYRYCREMGDFLKWFSCGHQEYTGRMITCLQVNRELMILVCGRHESRSQQLKELKWHCKNKLFSRQCFWISIYSLVSPGIPHSFVNDT